MNFLFQDPFVFSPYHKALREPFDYYKFGQNYIRPLVDFRLAELFFKFPTSCGGQILLFTKSSVHVHSLCKIFLVPNEYVTCFVIIAVLNVRYNYGWWLSIRS